MPENAQPQIQNEPPDGARVRELSAVRPPAPTDGPRRAPASAFRRKPRGPRAAANRALRLRRGLGELPAHKEALLTVTARLLVHFENASDRLYRDGELTKDGEVRALLPRVLDLAREVRENLALLADGVSADPFDLGGGR